MRVLSAQQELRLDAAEKWVFEMDKK